MTRHASSQSEGWSLLPICTAVLGAALLGRAHSRFVAGNASQQTRPGGEHAVVSTPATEELGFFRDLFQSPIGAIIKFMLVIWLGVMSLLLYQMRNMEARYEAPFATQGNLQGKMYLLQVGASEANGMELVAAIDGRHGSRRVTMSGEIARVVRTMSSRPYVEAVVDASGRVISIEMR